MGTSYENNQMSLDKTKLSGIISESIRNSSYTISVKLETEEDKYMLLHGYTGAIDIVSENVVNYLNNVNNPESKNVDVSESTFNVLKARGYLTEKTEEEEVAFVCKFANLLHQKDKKLHKGFLFLVAYDCNFRCPYCYESTVLKNSRQWTKKVFSKEMVDRAYEAMIKIGGDKKFHSSLIALYGGEPLLAKNKEIVEYIVNKGNDLGYRFMAVTNGYDLDVFKDILGPNKIQTLQITIDGIKEKHDQRRIHYQTKKSFDKIIANIGMALEQGTSITIRVNTDANNFNELKSIEQLFKELGYFDKGRLHIHSALLFDFNKNDQPSNNKNLNFLNQSEYNKRHKEIAYKYGCTISGVAQILLHTLIAKKRVNLASSYCAAQVGSYILDPFGDIYSCWEDVGKTEKIIGHYANSDCIEWTEMKNIWHNQNIASSLDCVQCKYAFFCRGGCIAQGENRTGKFSPGFCNSFPDTFQYAVNLAYSKMSEQNAT
jgi:uncharacterized protein